MDHFLSSLNLLLHESIQNTNSATEVHLLSCVPFNSGYKISFPAKNYKLSGDILHVGKNKCWVLEVTDAVYCFTWKEIKVERVLIKDFFNGNEKYLKALRRLIKMEIKPRIWNFLDQSMNRIEKKINNSHAENLKLNKNYKIFKELPKSQINIVERNILCENANNAFSFYNKNLNLSQQKAVIKALNFDSFKLIGPPGTGKTTTILEIIHQFRFTKNILVCGPSNTSIDNILFSFIQNNENIKILRIGDPIKCHPNLKRYNLSSIVDAELNYLDLEINKLKNTHSKTEKRATKNRNLNNKAKNLRIELSDVKKDKKSKTNQIRKETIKSSEVVFSTLYGCLKIEDRDFDLVIIDECCQAQDIEIILAVTKGKQFILVGDPFQLGPVIEEKYHLNFYDKIKIDELILDEQYRMSSNPINFSNAYFYENKIKSSLEESFKFFEESNLMFIDTFDSYFIEGEDDNSKFNIEEVKLINDFLSYTERHKNLYETLKIGIIMPYSAQVTKLKEMHNYCNPQIYISTVDSFQGQERDIIVISLVRSNFEEEIGFMEEIRRMNVAMTRCKKGLMIIGNSKTFKNNRFFRELIEFLYDNAFCIDPVSFRVLISV